MNIKAWMLWTALLSVCLAATPVELAAADPPKTATVTNRLMLPTDLRWFDVALRGRDVFMVSAASKNELALLAQGVDEPSPRWQTRVPVEGDRGCYPQLLAIKQAVLLLTFGCAAENEARKLDPASGAVAWTKPFGTQRGHYLGHHNGQVFLQSATKIHVLDAATGATVVHDFGPKIGVLSMARFDPATQRGFAVTGVEGAYTLALVELSPRSLTSLRPMYESEDALIMGMILGPGASDPVFTPDLGTVHPTLKIDAGEVTFEQLDASKGGAVSWRWSLNQTPEALMNASHPPSHDATPTLLLRGQNEGQRVKIDASDVRTGTARWSLEHTASHPVSMHRGVDLGGDQTLLMLIVSDPSKAIHDTRILIVDAKGSPLWESAPVPAGHRVDGEAIDGAVFARLISRLNGQIPVEQWIEVSALPTP